LFIYQSRYDIPISLSSTLRRQTFNGLIKNPSSDSHITIAMSLAGMFEEKGLANRRATIRKPKKIVNIPATLFTN